MAFINKIRKTLNRITEVFTISLVVVLVILVAAQVFWRYVLSNSLSWSEELARILFIWIIFLGTEITLRRRGHIAIDSLLQSLKDTPRLILNLIIDLFIVVFAVIVLISGIELMELSWKQPSPALQISKSWIYLAVPLSMVLILINTFYKIIINISRRSADDPENSGR